MKPNEQDNFLKELIRRSENNKDGIEIPSNQTLEEFIEFIENMK